MNLAPSPPFARPRSFNQDPLSNLDGPWQEPGLIFVAWEKSRWVAPWPYGLRFIGPDSQAVTFTLEVGGGAGSPILFDLTPQIVIGGGAGSELGLVRSFALDTGGGAGSEMAIARVFVVSPGGGGGAEVAIARVSRFDIGGGAGNELALARVFVASPGGGAGNEVALVRVFVFEVGGGAGNEVALVAGVSAFDLLWAAWAAGIELTPEEADWLVVSNPWANTAEQLLYGALNLQK